MWTNFILFFIGSLDFGILLFINIHTPNSYVHIKFVCHISDCRWIQSQGGGWGASRELKTFPLKENYQNYVLFSNEGKNSSDHPNVGYQ